MKKQQKGFLLLVIIIFLLVSSTSVYAVYTGQNTLTSSTSYTPNEVIVKFKDSSLKLDTNFKEGNIPTAVVSNALAQTASVLEEEEDLVLKDTLTPGRLGLYETKNGESIEKLIERLKKNPNVEYVEPNYIYQSATINTNDTYKDNLWGLDNTGQTLNGTVGTSDADMDVPEAWEIPGVNTNDVIVAVIDVGVGYHHPDLIDNMWDGTNCLDENGVFLGGCEHGYNYVNNTKNPLPGAPINPGHGTHVAGIIGAKKNNGLGIIGISQNARIMALKVDLSSYQIVKAINFAIKNNVKIINASYGGTGMSQTEYNAINSFINNGGIFIAAAGNDTSDNDTTSFYPASFNLDEIVSVAATNQLDGISSFSNWGLATVDIAAPGSNIFSIVCTSDCTTSIASQYQYWNGTSMATPQVSGLAALIWGINSSLSNLGVKNIILSTGDSISSLNSKILTGKRINAYNALNSLSNLSLYIPTGGYTNDNIIPASQINVLNGAVTVNFKIKDAYSGLTEQLSDFSYSTDGGTFWSPPTNGDSSFSLSPNWNSNNYISKTDYSGSSYSFTFNSDIDSAGIISNITSNNIKIRFKINNGINSSDSVISESFSISNYSPELNIIQPPSSVSLNADTYTIVGNTDSGSIIEIYKDNILVKYLQLGLEEENFSINVDLEQNSANYFIVKTKEPIYNSEKIISIPLIIEEDIPYEWHSLISAGSRNWSSVASSSDGTKLIASVNGGYLYTSDDSGNTWSEKISAGSRNWSSVASSSDGTKLIASVNGGYLYTSDDSGNTWSEITSLGVKSWKSIVSSSDAMKISFVENVCVNMGTLFNSNDGGLSWNNVSVSGNLYLYYLPDGTKLLAADGYGGQGCGANTGGGYIYTSHNSGNTWLENSSAGLNEWRSITASSDGSKIFAGVDNGHIYISYDSGLTWSEKATDDNRNWSYLKSSLGGDKLVAIADHGVYSSFDSGVNWIPRTSDNNFLWSAVASTSSGEKIFATVSGGYIYKYIPASTVPILSISDATLISQNSSTLNGNITGTGGFNPTIRGFEYGLTIDYGTLINTTGLYSTGEYSQPVSTLTCNTTYHYRSYAINDIGIGYSDDRTFTTLPCDEVLQTKPIINELSINGNLKSGQTLTGLYTYFDLENDLEGISSYRWLRDGIFISGATSITYTTKTEDIGKTITFEVTPVALTGELVGSPVVSVGVIIIKPTSSGGGGGGGGGGSNTTTIPTIPVQVIPSVVPIVDEGCLPGYLFSVKTGIKCPITTTIPIITTPTISNSISTITRTLKQGMEGNDVKELQKYLNTHNYPVSLTGAGSLNNETTYFGLKTKQAVTLFQKANGLLADGMVGKMTRERMK